MKNWDSLDDETINKQLKAALADNYCYIDKRNEIILGLPGTVLETKLFKPSVDSDGGVQLDMSSKILQTYFEVLFHNPNHIGNHTLNKKSEPAFRGTQKIEKRLLSICAEHILDARENEWNGYVATGGTEANIYALYALREYFIGEFSNAKVNDIVIVCSEDTHSSIKKAARILSLDICRLSVNSERQIMIGDSTLPSPQDEDDRIILHQILKGSKKYCIVIANMGTTMFGSVDSKETIQSLMSMLKQRGIIETRVHVDAAFGGFIYPFTSSSNEWSFKSELTTSFTLDPHKMLQVPYSTGIFLTKNIGRASDLPVAYIPGGDTTLVGSRSGAAAIFSWIVLMLYGSDGGKKFLDKLLKITDKIDELLNVNIRRYRAEHMNIIAIYKSQFLDDSKVEEVIRKYGLHYDKECFNITVMNHVVLVPDYEKKIKEFTKMLNNIPIRGPISGH